jgi:ribosomal protein S9
VLRLKPTKNVTQFKPLKLDSKGRAHAGGRRCVCARDPPAPARTARARRKDAKANVIITPSGNGTITVNGHALFEYFKAPEQRAELHRSFEAAGLPAFTYNIDITVFGGGVSGTCSAACATRSRLLVSGLTRATSCAASCAGQAGAARLGIARALATLHPEVIDRLNEGNCYCAVAYPCAGAHGTRGRVPVAAGRPPRGAEEARPEEGSQEVPVGQEMSASGPCRLFIGPIERQLKQSSYACHAEAGDTSVYNVHSRWASGAPSGRGARPSGL